MFMTYAKDIILDLNYKSKESTKRGVNLLLSKIKNFSTILHLWCWYWICAYWLFCIPQYKI